LTTAEKKVEYDNKLAEKRREEERKKRKEQQERIENFLKFSVYPTFKKLAEEEKVLTNEKENALINTAMQKLGLSETACRKLIEYIIKEFNLKREKEATKSSVDLNLIESFKDNVKGALSEEGHLKPQKEEHLLSLAKKYKISEEEARRIIDECITEKKEEERRKRERSEKWRKPPSVPSPARKPVLVVPSAKKDKKIIKITVATILAIIVTVQVVRSLM
jgi:hypothetical protein